jgi:hypothetical protein
MPGNKGYLRNKNLKPAGVEIEFTEEQVKEYIKCAKDPVYFAKKYVKVVTLDKGVTNFNLYDYQENLVKLLQKERFVITKLPRQSGKTVTVGCCYVLHKVLFNQSMRIGILANKSETAREILSKVKQAYEHLPWWLQQGVVEWNKGTIELENGSKIIAGSTTSNSIRGFSFNCIVLDEFAHVSNNVALEFFTSVYPVITAGQNTQMIVISTPNGLNLFYQMWKAAITKKNEYVAFEVSWRQTPQYPGGPLRDDDWKKKQIANTSDRQFASEFETSFIGSSNTLIDADKLNILSYGIPKTQNKDGLAIYEEPIKKNEETNTEDHVYFMAVDVARGQNKDYSAFVVIDITSMPYRVVAKFKNNLISPLLLPSYVFSVGKKYNNAYILVETNDVGSQVADILHSDLEYENLIKSNYKGSKGQIITEFKGTSSNLGVRTTLPVKKLGCSVLKNLIETDKLLTEDPDIVNELTTFIAQGKSFAAEEGHNDDLVMCLVLFSWASRQQFFENLTNNDVRVAMFKNEIIQIEQEIIPFFMQDGQDDSEFDDGKDFWQDAKKEKNSLSTQIWFF